MLGTLVPGVVVPGLVVPGLVVATAGVARADSAPPIVAPATPVSVTADPLPTVQIDGVVWAQVTVGNTVYATGEFTTARPAGAAPGTQGTRRSNLLAYDIRTGVLIGSFAHGLDAAGRSITASPDGTRVYVGGDFTHVDGIVRGRIAAFDTATGALVPSFHPDVRNTVGALAASDSTVYAGGSFTSVGGTARTRLAAMSASSGALLSWAPAAQDHTVTALLLSPDHTRVVAGGNFPKIGTTTVNGSASLGATTGALLPWAVNQKVKNFGANAGITSLRTDGKLVYGTAYSYVRTGNQGRGNLEGSFAADPSTGRIVWLEDCHGDSYDTVALGGVVYLAGHPYFCGNVGGFPDTYPNRVNRRAIAFSAAATGTVATNTHDTDTSTNWGGLPAPTLQTWYPVLAAGAVTHQSQAAWSTTGNSRYVAFGGEFPKVNNIGQQGLVRFALPADAPNRRGPAASALLTPSVRSDNRGTARVTWTTTSDPDNASLTYQVVRDGTATPWRTVTVPSSDWAPRTLGATDTGLVPGSTHRYRVRVRDPFGNGQSSPSTSVTVSGTPLSAYARSVLGDGAGDLWRLGETSGSVAYDTAGYADLTVGSGVTRGSTSAVGGSGGSSDGASTFDGTTSGTAGASPAALAGSTPAVSVEAWFRTRSTRGGKIVGFGNASTGASTQYDRSLYVDAAGKLRFGVFTGTTRTVVSPSTYTDGSWHHVVGTLGAGGLALFVDGREVARDPAVTGSTPMTGVWRIGGDSLDYWPARPASDDLAGSIDEVAVYPTALSAATVAAHVRAAGRTPAAASR